MIADPATALAPLADDALRFAHDRLHKVATVGDITPEEVEAHHLIADELRHRGLGHPAGDDVLHASVITMSKVRVPLRKLAKMLSPAEVNTITQMAIQNGTSFADVYELLTANGWVLRAEPAESDDPTDTEGEDEVDDETTALVPRQVAIYETFKKIAERFGLFDQSTGPDGAHYVAESPFAAEGMVCANCVFFRGGRKCEIVAGDIAPEAVCKLWVIPGQLLTPPASDAVTAAAGSFPPPDGVQAEAARALEWIRDGHAGPGFTPVGVARARDLANGRPVSEDTLRRMSSYFARHEVDKEGSGWSPDEDGYPSPGRVAWAAWGGDPGRAWADRLVASFDQSTEKALIVKAVDEKRFTLGPWYVPLAVDAHGEWTDSDELQAGLWNYVKGGNREIRLQHTPGTKAGEWVEAMTWPFPVEVPMVSPDTGQVVRKMFPAGTVFLGVQWEPWAWEMVKAGQIRGYSMGGSAERVDEDPMIYADVRV